MARRRDNVPNEQLIALNIIPPNVGVDCTEVMVRQKVKPSEIVLDWNDVECVTWSRAREVRRQLIDELHERHMKGIAANAEVDRQKREAMRERAEASRRQRERAIFGTRVSVPGESPQPWVDLPSSGDDG